MTVSLNTTTLVSKSLHRANSYNLWCSQTTRICPTCLAFISSSLIVSVFFTSIIKCQPSEFLFVSIFMHCRLILIFFHIKRSKDDLRFKTPFLWCTILSASSDTFTCNLTKTNTLLGLNGINADSLTVSSTELSKKGQTLGLCIFQTNIHETCNCMLMHVNQDFLFQGKNY